MIDVWIADVTPLLDEQVYQEEYEKLPEFRKQKAERLRFPSDRAQSVGVWRLLQTVRERYNISEKAVFNLSHSGNYVLCAVDRAVGENVLVGCDVEKIQKMYYNVARRVLYPDEYEQMMGEQESDRSECFYRYWVLKESALKATRYGLTLDMRTLQLELTDPPRLLKSPEQIKENLYFREYRRDDLMNHISYRIAVCSSDSEITQKMNEELIDIWKKMK